MARFSYDLPAMATDFSAALSMVSSIGGMSVLHAPSGCMGDYCSFDEPEWVRNPGMTYCSMLKEDETIFGNDDIIIDKMVNGCERMHPPFMALIGSPITALIGTDLNGIADLTEERTGVPVIAIDTTGFGNYQDGLLKAFKAIADRFQLDGDTVNDVDIVGINKFDYHIGDDLGYIASRLRPHHRPRN